MKHFVKYLFVAAGIAAFLMVAAPSAEAAWTQITNEGLRTSGNSGSNVKPGHFQFVSENEIYGLGGNGAVYIWENGQNPSLPWRDPQDRKTDVGATDHFFVSDGSPKQIYGLGQNGTVYRAEPSTKAWLHPITASGLRTTAVESGGNPGHFQLFIEAVVYGLGQNGRIYRTDASPSWSIEVTGGGIVDHFYVTPDSDGRKIYGLDANGGIFKWNAGQNNWDGVTPSGLRTSVNNGKAGYFQYVSPTKFYGLGGDGNVYLWESPATSWTKLTDQYVVNDAFHVTPTGVIYGLSGNGAIHRWDVPSATPYLLSVFRGGNGTVTDNASPHLIDCGSDCSESYAAGTPVTLTATPASGSTFTSWSQGECSGTATTCTLTMNAAKSVTATFTATGGGDTTPPVRSNGSPSGTLPAGTTAVSLSLVTNENATCRSSTQPNRAYADMTADFSSTGGTSHSQAIVGLTNGASYSYYVKCQDTASPPNTNTDDYTITFSVATTGGGTITITSPNGGEVWQKGIAHTITWTSSNISSSALMTIVLRNLLTGGSYTDYVLANDIPNDGTETVTIPTSVPDGVYKVQVKTAVSPGVVVDDWSNGTFTIQTGGGGGNDGSATPALQNNDLVKTTVRLKIRSGPSTSAAPRPSSPAEAGATGRINCSATPPAGVTAPVAGINCPTVFQGAVWWYVNYDNEDDGWSAEQFGESEGLLVKIVGGGGPYTLTVTKAGTGSGTATSNPAGINCGTDCSQSYANNTSVALIATPSSGSTFAGWSGHADCSDGSLTMNANKSCTATFNTTGGTATLRIAPSRINSYYLWAPQGPSYSERSYTYALYDPDGQAGPQPERALFTQEVAWTSGDPHVPLSSIQGPRAIWNAYAGDIDDNRNNQNPYNTTITASYKGMTVSIPFKMNISSRPGTERPYYWVFSPGKLFSGLPFFPYNGDDPVLKDAHFEMTVREGETKTYPIIIATGFGETTEELSGITSLVINFDCNGRVVNPTGAITCDNRARVTGLASGVTSIYHPASFSDVVLSLTKVTVIK